MVAEITFAGRQSLGSRENQEDCYGFCPLGEAADAPLLMALADGMGGHERGEVASELAVNSFIQGFDLRQGNRRRALMDAVLEANQLIEKENDRMGGAPDEMGTTFIGAYLEGSMLHFISVGDSPLFLFRDNSLFRLNAEHVTKPTENEEGEQIRAGMLMSALTGGEITAIDAPAEPVSLHPGDMIICASDGLNTLDGKRLAGKLEVHAACPAAEIAQLIVDAVVAERKNRQDNVTVCVIKPLVADSKKETISNKTQPDLVTP